MSRTRDLAILTAAHHYNRVRFAIMRRLLAGRVEFGPGCDVWTSSFVFRGQGHAVFGPGCAVERQPQPLLLEVAEGGLFEAGPRAWFRGKYRPNAITCFEGAKVTIGEGSLLNGAIISARSSVAIGVKAMVSWDAAVLDSNLHPLDNDNPLEPRPVKIGDHVLIGSGAIVLPGVNIGDHCVIGAKSVVTKDVPPCSLAAGSPARVIRTIGERDGCL